MPLPSTPNQCLRPLLAEDPTSWRNAAVSAYVVQAVPATSRQHGEPLLRDACVSRDGDPCPGTTEEAIRGVRLDRDEALHVVEHHYSHSNWSLCRFVDHGSPQYACDLVFEVDAHASAPSWFPDVNYYVPAVGVAVLVGRRILDYLVGVLDVDASYITTLITRMGCRVTVDWRAFGPRRVHQVLAVVRYIETRLFAEDDLDRLSDRLAKAMRLQARRLARTAAEAVDEPFVEPTIKARVNVDGDIYRVSESNLRKRDTAAEYKGPLVRPIGSLHSQSGMQGMHFRATPVPHESFRAGNARRLARVSRSLVGPGIGQFMEPRLFVAPWPERRRPSDDQIIEGTILRPRLPVATKLVALFEEWDRLPLPEEYRREVDDRTKKARSKRSRTLKEEADITPEVVESVVLAMGTKVQRRKDKYRFECPYCLARGSKNTASLFIDSGVFNCFSDNCVKSISLYQLAADRGLAHLVPFRRISSTPLRWMKVKDLPRRETARWEDVGLVTRETFADVGGARKFIDDQMTDLLQDDKWGVLIVRGPTGSGKTTTILRAIEKAGLIVRGSVPRDESRQPLIDILRAKPIDGRRTGDDGNCKNDAIELLKQLGLPNRLACNQECPHRQGCAYLAQFEGNEGVSLALNHAHLGLLDLDKFGNGSDLVVVDENPLLAAVETVSLTAKEVDRLRVGVDITSPSWPNESCQDVTLDDPIMVRNIGATTRLEVLIAWLEEALGTDAMSRLADESVGDVAADLVLARHWSTGGILGALLGKITEEDLEEHRKGALTAAGEYIQDRTKPQPPKAVLDNLVGGLRELLWMAEAGLARPASLYVVRGDTSWSLRVTQRRNLFHGRTIILSSSLTPTQFVAAFGDVADVRIIEPVVEEREKRILVADHMFGSTKLTGVREDDRKQQERLFTTVRALIARERERTGLPVVLCGRASVLNMFINWVTGTKLEDDLVMPYPNRRKERMEKLRAITEPLGFLCAYAGGVSGDNSYGVLQPDGSFRFVRSAILLGNVIPPLGEVEAGIRGLMVAYPFAETIEEPGIGAFSRSVERVVDWTAVPRTVAIPGTELGEGDAMTALTAQNVMGFGDGYASDLLHHFYEGEVLQMLGRMRGSIPDPQGVEARAYLLAHVVVPEFTIDETPTLDELRQELGLDGDGPKRTRGAKRSNAPEVLARRIAKFGKLPTVRWLTQGLVQRAAEGPGLAQTFHPARSLMQGVVDTVRGHWEASGHAWTDDVFAACVAAGQEAIEAARCVQIPSTSWNR